MIEDRYPDARFSNFSARLVGAIHARAVPDASLRRLLHPMARLKSSDAALAVEMRAETVVQWPLMEALTARIRHPANAGPVELDLLRRLR